MVDVATLKVTSYILVGKRVWHLAFSSDGTRMFTTNGVSNDVTVVDLVSLKPIKSIPVGRYPWGVAVRGSTEKATADVPPAATPDLR